MMEPLILIEEGLQLKPAQRFMVVDALVRSLDVPNPNIEKQWADEAQRRLTAYKEGRLETISFEEMFK